MLCQFVRLCQIISGYDRLLHIRLGYCRLGHVTSG